MTDKERDAKLEAARNLRKKATSTTSEAEAMACIALVRKLQAKYGLTLDEIEAESEATSRDHFKDSGMYSGEGAWNHVDMNLTFDIGRFCRVKVGTEFRPTSNGGKRTTEYFIHYFGHEADVENAVWLRENVKAAMLFEWEIYRDFVMKPGTDRVIARRSFCMGMSERIRQRIAVAEQDDDDDCTALTIRVNALVEKRAQEVGFVEAQGAARRRTKADMSAYGAGQAAGGRVDIGRGVTHRADTSNHAASGPKLIR